MDDFAIAAISEQCCDFLAGMTCDALRLNAVVVDQTARDVGTLFADTGNDRAALKFPEHLFYAYGQQAFALIAQRVDRTPIQHQTSGDLQMSGQPLFACREGEGRGGEQGADSDTLKQTQQYVRLMSGGDDGMRAAVCRTFCREYLGEHAAATDTAAGTPCHSLQLSFPCLCRTHQCGTGITAGVGGV